MDRHYTKSQRNSVVVKGIILGVFIAGAMTIGFWFGQTSVSSDLASPQMVAEIDAIFKGDRELLKRVGRNSEVRLDVFSGWVGTMHAELLRLNALGERLVRMAKLDPAEFDFEKSAPVGAPTDIRATKEIGLSELVEEIIVLPGLIDDRKRKLKQLEQVIMERGLKKHAVPSGWPIRSGYITSRFGYRIHPILNKPHLHSGIDFAAKPGEPILATADGAVVFSGQKPGYGYVVEIRHMDGLETCYAHNRENLVEEGELVKKGQIIARLGSTGRSTGPHVHYEVRKHGKAVNPISYIGYAGPTVLSEMSN